MLEQKLEGLDRDGGSQHSSLDPADVRGGLHQASLLLGNQAQASGDTAMNGASHVGGITSERGTYLRDTGPSGSRRLYGYRGFYDSYENGSSPRKRRMLSGVQNEGELKLCVSAVVKCVKKHMTTMALRKPQKWQAQRLWKPRSWPPSSSSPMCLHNQAQLQVPPRPTSKTSQWHSPLRARREPGQHFSSASTIFFSASRATAALPRGGVTAQSSIEHG